MTVRVTGVLAPFGLAIADAVIKMTSMVTQKVLKGSVLRECTDEYGVYDFTLENGIYLLEYKQTNVMVEVGYIYVTDDTPDEVTIEELVSTFPLVPVPPVSSVDEVDWNTLIEIHEQTVEAKSDVTQAVDGDTASIDSEEASETPDSSLARSVDNVTSSLSNASKQVMAFTEEGDSMVQEDESLTANGMTYAIQRFLAKTQQGTAKISSKLSTDLFQHDELVTQEHLGNDHIFKVRSGITSANSSRISETKLVQNDVEGTNENSHFEAFQMTQGLYTADFSELKSVYSQWIDDDNNIVDKPSLEYSRKSTLQGDVHFTEIEEGSEQHINGDDNSSASWFKKVTTYAKTAIDEIINDGFQSIKRYTVDLFQVGNTLEVDTENQRVTVNGRLIVNNPEDFKGDTIFQVFQYSVDGLTDWHEQFELGDIWRRHNESVNGYIDPTKWSAPYRLQAEDGLPGDTIYFDYEYSTDAQSWHDDFVDGDIWRRERIIENGFPTSDWSEPARIKGADGIPGDTVYIEYQYSVDGISIWHSNFSTGDHYRRERLVTNGVPGPWSDSAKLVPVKDEDYYDGIDGYNNVTVYLYQRASSAPAKPSTVSTYSFASSTLTGFNNGWVTSIPSGTNPLYVIAATASSTGSTDTIAGNEWTDPVILALDGIDGLNAASLFLYKRGVEVPALPTTASTYTFATGELTGFDNGWSRTVPGGTDPVYVTSATAISRSATDTIPASEWAVPQVLVKNGVDGENGLHGNGSFLYRLSSESLIPSTDAGKDSHVAALAQRPAQDGDILSYQGDATVSDNDQFTRQYLRDADIWTEFAFSVNGSAIINGTLAAIKLQAATITGDKIAAETIQAGNLAANSVTGNKISSSTTVIAGSGSTQAGMNGYDSGDYWGWRFWAGASTPGSAPYRVYRDGRLWATNANISGVLNATSGTLNNVTINQSCTILGSLSAAQVSGAFYTVLHKSFPRTRTIINTRNDVVTLFSVRVGNTLNVARRVGIEDPRIGLSSTGGTIERYAIRDYFNGVLINTLIDDTDIPNDQSGLAVPPSTFDIPAGSSGLIERKFELEDEKNNPNITITTYAVDYYSGLMRFELYLNNPTDLY